MKEKDLFHTHTYMRNTSYRHRKSQSNLKRWKNLRLIFNAFFFFLQKCGKQKENFKTFEETHQEKRNKRRNEK